MTTFTDVFERKEVKYRLACCRAQGIPVTNYGILIAYLNGILPRTLALFPTVEALLHV